MKECDSVQTREPIVTVIIPSRPGDDVTASISSVRSQVASNFELRVVVVRGLHRSMQRNMALASSASEFVWFLDNDVDVQDSSYLARALEHLSSSDVGAVGGPSLSPKECSSLQSGLSNLLSSPQVMFHTCARYARRGSLRDAGSEELILCSLVARRSALGGGFATRLHAGNEENELLSRMQTSGWRLIYDPDLCVFRHQRATVLELAKQMVKYGRSRSENYYVSRRVPSPAFFAPILLLLYSLVLPVLTYSGINLIPGTVLLAPLVAYIFLIISTAITHYLRAPEPGVFAWEIFLFPLIHYSYAIGNLLGLLLPFRFDGAKGDQFAVEFFDLSQAPFQSKPDLSTHGGNQ